MYKAIPDCINFGVEMELTFPLGVDYNTALPWNKVNDRSIQCNIGSRCQTIELVSPILNGETGVAQVIKVISQCKSQRANTNTSTGFHVHVSIKDHKYELEELKKICNNFLKFEHSIDLIMAPSRIKNKFCMSNRALLPDDNAVAKDLIYKCETILQLQDLMCKRNRYYKLNLMALDKHGTLEFRQHMGTLNTEQVECWLRLVLWFVCNSIIQPRSLALLNGRTCEFGFEAMFKFLIKEDELRKFFYRRKEEILKSNNGKSTCGCGC
jgi:hypothetical protein